MSPPARRAGRARSWRPSGRLNPTCQPPAASLLRPVPRLRKGQLVDLDALAYTLSRLGYERVPTIEQEGSWSRRGRHRLMCFG